MRSAFGPLGLVAEEFLGVDLFGEVDRDYFFDLFDVLVVYSSSKVRVGCGECTAVLTWGSVVDAAGVADPGSDLSSVARETLWSFFIELPFAGLAARIGTCSFSSLIEARLEIFSKNRKIAKNG